MLHFFDIGVVGDGEVDDHARPALRDVADPEHFSVADKPQDAVDVAHLGDPDPDRLDDAGRQLQVDDVADAELILHDHEQSVEDVLDDVLRAEPESRTDGGGEECERTDHAWCERLDDDDESDDSDDHVHDVAEYRAERSCSLDEADCRKR